MQRLSNGPLIVALAVAMVGIHLAVPQQKKRWRGLLIPACLYVLLLAFASSMHEEARIAVLGFTYSIVLLVAHFLWADANRHLTISNLLLYVLTCFGLVSGNVLCVALAGLISLGSGYFLEKGQELRGKSWYMLGNILLIGLALVMMYDDLDGFDLHGGSPIRGETLAMFSLAALFRLGVVPFHGYMLQRIRRYGFPALIAVVNPLGYLLPLLLVLKAEIAPSTDYYEDAVLLLGLGVSWYFALASFSEKTFELFVYYVFASIAALAISALPMLGIEFELAGVYFFASTTIGTVGLMVCLHYFRVRYGLHEVQPLMGMFAADKRIGFLFIFFIFSIGCMPLTMSYLGEDVMLYQLFVFHPLIGIGALGVLSLISISLYRFYTDVFGGPWPNYPRFALLIHERIALGIVLAAGLAMPVLSFWL